MSDEKPIETLPEAEPKHVSIPPPLRTEATVRGQRRLAGRIMLAGCALFTGALIIKLLIPDAQPEPVTAQEYGDRAGPTPWQVNHKAHLHQRLTLLARQSGGRIAWRSYQPTGQPEYFEIVQLEMNTPGGKQVQRYLFDERSGFMRPLGGADLGPTITPFGWMTEPTAPSSPPAATPERPCSTCGFDLADWKGKTCPICDTAIGE